MPLWVYKLYGSGDMAIRLIISMTRITIYLIDLVLELLIYKAGGLGKGKLLWNVYDILADCCKHISYPAADVDHQLLKPKSCICQDWCLDLENDVVEYLE